MYDKKISSITVYNNEEGNIKNVILEISEQTNEEIDFTYDENENIATINGANVSWK